MSRTWKKWILIGGILVLVPGVIGLPAILCTLPLLALSDTGDSIYTGIGGVTFLVLTLGAGGLTVLHSRRSLSGKPSSPVRLPPAWMLAGIFGLCLAAGTFLINARYGAALFLPTLLWLAALLPPLLALAWFAGPGAQGLTWRRTVVAAAGGATVSLAIAIVLETLLPLAVLALVLGLGETVARRGEAVLAALAGQDIAKALADPGFIYVFIQLAVIAPLVEELAKPLVTLPLIRRLERRDAFLVAAAAGVGFAAIENVLYASAGLYLWAGIFIVRAIGGAIHPLGAGLVGLGWRDVLHGEPGAWRRAMAGFGLAAGMHAVWNGGSLIVVTLAGARFFGQLPPEINILGLSAAGTTLALLVVLGLAALWLGRAIVRRVRPPVPEGAEPFEAQWALSDRAVAIWALACLAAIVPAGITSLKLLVH